jgi:hypothetical protein
VINTLLQIWKVPDFILGLLAGFPLHSFTFFLSSGRQMMRQCHKTGHNHSFDILSTLIYITSLTEKALLKNRRIDQV